ncbi:putative SOS response-associated peptidase YedK [Haloactinospora alba]|uniref:Abasic site processing protein n=1 Tax=Haloactinospora alba TaxID=405555 RepID=A0A543NFA1_9ACTN|nr:SOS response-associated peptidase [Haloactinospora alba]TQN30512.1 putative SOS response-associated peptidase YedK [Haloactinospora alba]
MCGRYAQTRSRNQLQLAFGLPETVEPDDRDPSAWPPWEEPQPDYNIAPGRTVPAVLGPPPGGTGEGGAGPRSLASLRWGLVPSWAKDRNLGYKMINARSETVAEKPAYRTAFARRRCLLPADAYYEWQLVPSARSAEPGTSPSTDPEHKPRKARSGKRPYAIGYADDSPLALAGLFERWRDPERPEDDPHAWLWSCTVVTTEAAPELAHIHDRMPVVVPPDRWSTWLDPAAQRDSLLGVLESTPVGELRTRQVSTSVNSVRNNGPELLQPLGSGDGGDGTLF